MSCRPTRGCPTRVHLSASSSTASPSAVIVAFSSASHATTASRAWASLAPAAYMSSQAPSPRSTRAAGARPPEPVEDHGDGREGRREVGASHHGDVDGDGRGPAHGQVIQVTAAGGYSAPLYSAALVGSQALQRDLELPREALRVHEERPRARDALDLLRVVDLS